MTLTQTLQIEERYLQDQELRAMTYCERRWSEEKCPAERWPLVNFIEKMLQELQAIGTGYPSVLLLRKKQIQRGEFVALKRVAGKKPGRNVCPQCGGQGWRAVPYPNAAPSYVACDCPTGKDRAALLRGAK